MREKVALLLSGLDSEWNTVEHLVGKLRGKYGNASSGENVSEEKTVLAAYLLHNIYCALEEIFKQIAKTFENNIDDPSRYHAELLKRMTMDIYKMRPRFISGESFKALNEIRKFRHVFRHAYEYELEHERVNFLLQTLLQAWQPIEQDKMTFRQFLLQVLEESL
ncbi:MAG: hypothetical protein HQM12_11730 [SAR324 cluster bacterium]|nr:hypothetical protein [SAR324 cluster bacterium]